MKHGDIRGKRRGTGLEMRTFYGVDGRAYLVFRTASGSFHTFVETEAKQASRECGTPRASGTTRQMWSALWEKEV
jgi:hypothetical protein